MGQKRKIGMAGCVGLLWLLGTLCAMGQGIAEAETASGGVIGRIGAWYVAHMNYGTVMLLMTVESSFIPFPSEIVIPPAAYVAMGTETTMTPIGVWAFGTLGALLGALVNYVLARWLGRAIVYKFVDSRVGHLMLLSGEKTERAEHYFRRYGRVSTFLGRLLPAVRQLISVPAGLARMGLVPFCFYTLLGAGAWNAVLTAIGVVAGGQQERINALIGRYSMEVVAVALVIAGVYAGVVVRKKLKKRKSRE